MKGDKKITMKKYTDYLITIKIIKNRTPISKEFFFLNLVFSLILREYYIFNYIRMKRIISFFVVLGLMTGVGVNAWDEVYKKDASPKNMEEREVTLS